MIMRSLDKAREAYQNRDVKGAISAHSMISDEVHKEQGEYIKSAVYGGLDGIITSFAVVAGVTGGLLSAGVVIVIGFANLIADGISMAIGDYISSKAEMEFYEAERNREQWEVENYPEGEKNELKTIYHSQGMEESDADEMVRIISKNQKTWIDIMMIEELGLTKSESNPLINGLVTFVSFAVFGFIPLSVYVIQFVSPGLFSDPLPYAISLTLITLIILGVLKARFTGKNATKSGIEVLIIGGVAAAVAFLVGHLLSGLVK
jgi:vacuolar iron transporter family protein